MGRTETGLSAVRRREFLLAAAAQAAPGDLREIARSHVEIAAKHRGRARIWGRIGGSEAEHASAAALVEQLRKYLPQAALEPFSFQAHRALDWEVTLDGRRLETAMPAPFEARFPDGKVQAPLAAADPDQPDWNGVRGKWAFVRARTVSTAQNVVREKLLYQRAVEHGAAGLLFSLATPKTGRWRSVVPVDKAYAVKDTRYPDGRRPIPCFSVDAVDGGIGGGVVSAAIRYSADRHEGRSAVGFLPGSADYAIGVMCHIDSFFGGACDNASGIAAMVGLARELARVKRRPDIWFMGLSAHHDQAAGMRAWVARDRRRFERIRHLFLLEHVDALDSEEGRGAGWPAPLNNQRTAFLGDGGWPEVRALLPALVRESGVMTVTPAMQDACIADLFVTCGGPKSFCLMNAPPYYHTDHDTLDKIGERGIRNAVRFHMLLLERLRLAG